MRSSRQSRQTNPADLSHVAAALQKQATRDLAPLWGISATVVAFPSLRNVPVGYWPVVIVDDVQGAAGYHQDNHGRPYALVEYSASWSLTASHEVLEMLVDPFGHRTAAGRSPKPGQGQVEFLVEACDPCEAPSLAYTIDGVLVSDFITPRFYDPRQTSGARYSFGGHIQRAAPDPQRRLHLVVGPEVQPHLAGDLARHARSGVQGPRRGRLRLRSVAARVVDANTEHPRNRHRAARRRRDAGRARDHWQGATESSDALRRAARGGGQSSQATLT